MEKTIDTKILALKREKAALKAKKQGPPVIKRKPKVYVKPVFNNKSHKINAVKTVKPKPQLLITNGEQLGRRRAPPRRRARPRRVRGGRRYGGGRGNAGRKHHFRKAVAKASNLPPPMSAVEELPKPEESWFEKIMDVAPSVIEHVLPLVAGMGDYSQAPDEDILATGEKPRSNSLLSAATDGKVGSEVPYMHNDGNATRIQHREYIGDIYSSTSAFKTQTFTINPGMNETFPWLALIANQFTCYKLLGMIVEFVSEGSEYTNTAGLGYVALATQYNSYAPAFTDKRSMLNTQFADAAKPSKSFAHWIECKPDTIPVNELYVRSGTPPSGADKRLYDHAQVTLAVGGNTADGVVIGELWLTYDLEVFLPKTSDASGDNILFFDATLTTPSNTQPLGSAQWVPSSKTSFLPTLDPTGQVISFPNNIRGQFVVRFQWSSAAGVAPAYPTFTSANCTQSSTYPVIHLSPSAGTGVTSMMMVYSLILTKDGATVTLGAGGTLFSGGNGVCTCVISQIPLDPPPLLKGEIFDRKGVKRDEKYDTFMKRFREEDDDMYDHEDEYVVVKETKLFILELHASPHEPNAYRLYDEMGDDNDNYPIPSNFAMMLISLSDDAFNDSCVEFIKLINSTRKSSHH